MSVEMSVLCGVFSTSDWFNRLRGGRRSVWSASRSEVLESGTKKCHTHIHTEKTQFDIFLSPTSTQCGFSDVRFEVPIAQWVCLRAADVQNPEHSRVLFTA